MCFRTGFLQVLQNRFPHFGQQRQMGCCTSLAMANPDGLFAPVDVIKAQCGDLSGPYAIGRKQCKDRVIAQTFGRLVVFCHRQDSLHVLGSDGTRNAFVRIDRRRNYCG